MEFSAGADVSSSARDAFGAISAALPEEPTMLCLLLLHEFQHVKLGAVLDFVDLYDVTERRTFPVPWRADPRPLGGLLQGAYAHIAVADFWRRRSAASESAVASDALDRFARCRRDTLGVIGLLQDSGALTGLGEPFAASMHVTLESMRPPQ
ncbi:aKG-HExxH-type peptide beta-hydroxylase [Actinomadura nitritigenes]|uniref:aKG-HExxH-type peptide beta-hydroxylase n=1 Tax=Actinomadura nitritigenes TaxID=134602 RepID=UPI003D92269C